LYKLIGSSSGDKKRSIEDYKNGFVNLALPFFGFSEPIAPEKRKYNDTEFSDWDMFDFDHDITLQELVDYFRNEHNLGVNMISSGVSMLYSPFLNRKKAAERMPMKMSEIVTSITKKEIPEHVKWIVLVVCCDDDDDEDVDVPEVRIKIRN
ncbi:E1 ubiquitin-activating protein, partial [Linderina pennispora]